jgi:hypothetical protein
MKIQTMFVLENWVELFQCCLEVLCMFFFSNIWLNQCRFTDFKIISASDLVYCGWDLYSERAHISNDTLSIVYSLYT